MAFTQMNDINIMQASDNKTVSAGNGDDVYVIGIPALLTDGQQITISDTLGDNTLRLIDGLTIKTAQLSSTTLRLTLTNNAQITILSAHNFSFGVGGDAFGTGERVEDYATFVTNTIGLEGLPATGSLTKNDILIDKSGGVGNQIEIDLGSTDTYTGTSSKDTFTFAAQAALAATGTVSQAIISQFDIADDSLKFDLPTASGATNLSALNGLQGVSVEYNDLDNNTLINFGLDADGDSVTVTLNGIANTDWASINVSII
ncbi:MAG: hypothetical protein AB7U45_01445 [Desulfamplus sp.]